MKVSVIVAAYNAEKYVTETMESLANQSIDDYEIIVVNDGSKDRTWSMIEELQERGVNTKNVLSLYSSSEAFQR